MKILVTGIAGFIGFHVAKRLCLEGYQVVGLDDLNPYYDVRLKQARLAQLSEYGNFEFIHLNLVDEAGMAQLFERHRFERVIHLAAQAGVRYSTENPMLYIQSNIVGFTTLLEGCRRQRVEHLVYASSSSVYGLEHSDVFKPTDQVDHPISLYAASKKSNELMAHSYAHLYDLPTTGLRFFTVYGPWGRPDMALFKFTARIIKGEPIELYNQGDMQRDFTYIDDVVEAIIGVQAQIPTKDPTWNRQTGPANHSSAPYRIYNVGHGQPVKLLELVQQLEHSLGKPALINLLPMQPGDVYRTHADVEELYQITGFRPQTNITQGVEQFVQWYQSFYG